MPKVCFFYGIVIAVYCSDHLPAHFHALYAGHEAVISVEKPELLKGWLPRRAEAMALEWAALRRAQLMAVWERARRHERLAMIEPLD
jgi:hypothetical protein